MGTLSKGPTERLRRIGVRGGSISDLLAVGFSRSEPDAEMAEDMARSILQRYGNLRRLSDLGTEEIRELTGLEGFEATRAQALIELGRRIAAAGKGEVEYIEGPEDVYRLLEYLKHEKKEHFVAVLLDSKSGVLRTATIHVGTLTMSIVGPRELFREAVREGASSVIVAHNHPSGDPTPSPEDISISGKLVEVGDMLDIPVLDHVIIGEQGFTSLKKKGLM